MVNIEWCRKQPKGIKIIEPNSNLSKEYMQSAEETLAILKDIQNKSNMWLATTKYYCEYFAVYALLMKIGIKSEIHECTIKLSQILEKENLLPNGTHKQLLEDKQLRIDNQYYLKNKTVKINYTETLELILTIKKTINNITLEKINNIRKKIK